MFMSLVWDIERHNLSLLKSYNGKPVLITESGRVCVVAFRPTLTTNVEQGKNSLKRRTFMSRQTLRQMTSYN